jgi:hypothetical protein
LVEHPLTFKRIIEVVAEVVIFWESAHQMRNMLHLFGDSKHLAGYFMTLLKLCNTV